MHTAVQLLEHSLLMPKNLSNMAANTQTSSSPHLIGKLNHTQKERYKMDSIQKPARLTPSNITKDSPMITQISNLSES